MESAIYTIILLVGGYFGYRIGKDVGFNKGQVLGKIYGLTDYTRLDENERKFLFQFLEEAMDTENPEEIQEIYDRLKKTEDAKEQLFDIASTLAKFEVEGIMSVLGRKYRDTILGALKERKRTIAKQINSEKRNNRRFYRLQQAKGTDKSSKYSVAFDEELAEMRVWFDKNPEPKRAYDMLISEMQKHAQQQGERSFKGEVRIAYEIREAQTELLSPMIDLNGYPIVLLYNPKKKVLTHPYGVYPEERCNSSDKA